MRVRRSRLLFQSESEVGFYFGPEATKRVFKKVLLCKFPCRPKPSGISLETQGVENIPQISANLAEVDQNQHVRKAVSANLSVLK